VTWGEYLEKGGGGSIQEKKGRRKKFSVGMVGVQTFVTVGRWNLILWEKKGVPGRKEMGRAGEEGPRLCSKCWKSRDWTEEKKTTKGALSVPRQGSRDARRGGIL